MANSAKAECAKLVTSKEVDAMRPSRLWKTYSQIRLEGRLLAVPRTERRAIRTFVAGKRVR